MIVSNKQASQRVGLRHRFARFLDVAFWLRLGLVLGALGWALVLGWLLGEVSPTWVVIAAALPATWVVLDLLMKYQEFMPALILAISTITSFSIARGITPGLVMTAGFAALWVVKQLLTDRAIRLVRSPVMAACLALIGVAVLSTFWGRGMADPMLVAFPNFDLTQGAQLAILVLSPVALMLTANVIVRESHLRLLVWVFLALSTYGVIAEFLPIPRFNMRGLLSTWAVGLLYGQLLFNRTLPRVVQVLIVCVLPLWFVRFFWNGITWLSGWAPMVGVVVILTFLRSRKWFLVMMITVAAAVLLTLPWWQRIFTSEYGISGETRLGHWERLMVQPFVWQHFLFGTGPVGYARYFMTYFPTDAQSTHSNYIDIFFQMGLVGSLVFVWLFVALARDWWRLSRLRLESSFLLGYIHAAGAGMAAVLVSMFFGDWFTPFVYNQGLQGYSWTVLNWIFLGGLVAAYPVLQKRLADSQTQQSG